MLLGAEECFSHSMKRGRAAVVVPRFSGCMLLLLMLLRGEAALLERSASRSALLCLLSLPLNKADLNLCVWCEQGCTWEGERRRRRESHVHRTAGKTHRSEEES